MSKANAKKTPQQIAREQVAAEEESKREARIAEIAAAEEAKQEAERAEKEAVEARKKAAKEAEKLVERRKPLEDTLQAKIAEIAPVLEELADLHDRHKQALYQSLDPEYRNRHHEGYEKISFSPLPDWARSNHDVRDVVRAYLEGSLPALYRDAKAPKGALAEADPLTPQDADDSAGRPVGDFPWDELEQTRQKMVERDADEREQRRIHELYKKLEGLAAKQRQMRANYGRPPSWNEFVVPDERAWLHDNYSREEVDEAWSRVVGEEDRASPRPAASSDMVSGGVA